MSRCVWVSLVMVTVIAVPVYAQIAVIDPANLAQVVLIARRTQRQLDELQAQYRTILRMAQGLGNMEPYRVPTIPITRHDPSRWEYGRPWIEGLNSGDAHGCSLLGHDRALAASGCRVESPDAGRSTGV